MKLYIKEKAFTLWGRYDILDENEEIAYIVEGKASLGKKLIVKDGAGFEVGMLKQELWHMFSTFQIWQNEQLLGSVQQKLSFFRPKLEIDYRGWKIQGDFLEWNYTIVDEDNQLIGTITKELWHWTDHYSIEADDEDILDVLMLVLAIDAIQDAERAAAVSAS